MDKKKSQGKTPFWFYIVLIAIPFLFVVLIEVFLRILNYGDDYTQWVEITESKYVLSPDYTKKFFFTTQNAPYSNGDVFDIEKRTDAYRVFILGGSSAAGFPYTPNGDFGKYIQKRLEAVYPDKHIEIVNIAVTAVNTYTIRDLIPGVIDQQPDLIIIYAGHNEFFGALGAGSMESVGSSRIIVNLVIWLNNFKTTQLVRNTLKWFAEILSGDENKQRGGTLMARMAKEQLIPYKSDTYNAGMEQFEGNLRDILELTKDAGVPVILSTLTSNLKDQPPFESPETENYPEASDVFKEAQRYYEEGNYRTAESLFVFAKDLDALRFRASKEINDIIWRLGKEFKYPVADVYKAFNDASPGGVTGNNIMTDHLHPDLKGYQLMGKVFYETMEKQNLLPENPNFLPAEMMDSLAIKNFYFSRLDSTISRYRITILKNDWPFSEPKTGLEIAKQFNVADEIDSLALFVIDSKLTWEESHRRAANYYLRQKDFENFTLESLVLIDQYPYIKGYYRSAANVLLENKKFDLAYIYLKEAHRYSPDEFSSKWLGIIELSRYREKPAIKYLTESLNYNPNDPQVLFNLSGAYSMTGEFEKAINAIDRCLRADPDFPGATDLKRQLENAYRQLK